MRTCLSISTMHLIVAPIIIGMRVGASSAASPTNCADECPGGPSLRPKSASPGMMRVFVSLPHLCRSAWKYKLPVVGENAQAMPSPVASATPRKRCASSYFACRIVKVQLFCPSSITSSNKHPCWYHSGFFSAIGPFVAVFPSAEIMYLRKMGRCENKIKVVVGVARTRTPVARTWRGRAPVGSKPRSRRQLLRSDPKEG